MPREREVMAAIVSRALRSMERLRNDALQTRDPGAWGRHESRLKAGTREAEPREDLPRMPPGLIPVLAAGVDDAAVGFEEFVGHLENREHQSALRAPGDMAAAGLAPDVFAGLAFDARSRAFLVDQRALEHIGLLDVDVLVVGQHGAGREFHQ